MQRPLSRLGKSLVRRFLPECATRTSNVNACTFGPLASAFDKAVSPADTDTRIDNVGLFNVPELKSCDGFHLLKDDLVTRAEELVNRSISESPSPDVIAIFDNLSNELCKVADLAEFIRLAHVDKRFVEASEKTSFAISGLVEELNVHVELYKALKASAENNSNMDSVTKTVADLFLFDFHQSGIHLPPEQRKLATELHDAILVIGSHFTQGASQPREIPLTQWPRNLPIIHQITDKSTILVDSAYGDSNNTRLREHCYKFYMSHCPQQSELLENLMNYRHHLALTLGFESFSHRTLKNNMGSTPENVMNFLDLTLDMLEKPLQNDLELIRKYLKNIHSGSEGVIGSWDVRYYTNLIMAGAYDFKGKDISEYFSVGACMEGLNIVFSSLFGVNFNVVPPAPGEVWAPDVQKIEVRHESEGLLGYIYCDFYQRPGKLPQDCHFTIRGGKLLDDGTYQTPIVCLMCNFPSPKGNVPSLLSLSMTENLFHEMGHALHSMLGRARYQHVTGTRCATDFAEVPSILMEYFCRDPRVIRTFAKHYKTGEPISDDMINSIVRSRKLFTAIDLQIQTFYSMVDQKFHGKNSGGKSLMDMLDDLHEEYSPLSIGGGTSWHLRFSHFHSYGAKYYSYVWSRAVASSIWHSCFERDPFSRATGDKYRATMLQHGGGKPPQEMVDDMLGRKVTPKDLVSTLQTELMS